MTIRLASNNDIDSIERIENESFSNPFKRADLLYEISENPVSENPVSKFYVLESEDRVVGYIDFWITFTSATIDKIAIEKKSRNKGFAGKLLEFSLSILKENDVEFYTLEVRKSNVAAINLYKKFGFNEVTIKKNYYDDGEDAIYMVKGLI